MVGEYIIVFTKGNVEEIDYIFYIVIFEFMGGYIVVLMIRFL